MTIHSAAETLLTCQDDIGMYQDVSRMPWMGIRTLRRLTEISGWGLHIFISLVDVSLSVRDFYDIIKMSWWETLTTGYLEPNAYKKGKDKVTSQIQVRSQNGQT